MLKLFFTVPFWFLAWGTLSVAASENIVGTYNGVITSGRETAGTTIFSLSNAREISGVYKFKYDGGIETGELTNCQLTNLNLYCIWHDRFGSGDFNVTFSDDFSSFDGKWYEAVGDFQKYGRTAGERWSGEKS
ncbi:MAG: hypothetical protein ABJO30_05200 [Hyphomicrobiales bacterium]